MGKGRNNSNWWRKPEKQQNQGNKRARSLEQQKRQAQTNKSDIIERFASACNGKAGDSDQGKDYE